MCHKRDVPQVLLLSAVPSHCLSCKKISSIKARCRDRVTCTCVHLIKPALLTHCPAPLHPVSMAFWHCHFYGKMVNTCRPSILKQHVWHCTYREDNIMNKSSMEYVHFPLCKCVLCSALVSHFLIH